MRSCRRSRSGTGTTPVWLERVADNTFDFRGLTGQTGLSFINGGAGNDVVFASDFGTTMQGGGGNDKLYGGAGDDTLNGGPGRDVIHAGDGNDTVLIAGSNAIVDRIDGGDGIDTIKVLGEDSVRLAHFSALSSSIESWDGNGAGLVGTRADNTFDLRGLTSQTGVSSIRGGFGNDVVFASDFGSNIFGGPGRDHLISGAGADIFTGGSGRDVFTFNSGFGKDVITDFSPGHDQIAFDHSLFADYSQVIANASQVGNDVAISHGTDDLLTLKSVALSDLTDHDFSFV